MTRTLDSISPREIADAADALEEGDALRVRAGRALSLTIHRREGLFWIGTIGFSIEDLAAHLEARLFGLPYGRGPGALAPPDDGPRRAVACVGWHTLSLLVRGHTVMCGDALLIPADDLLEASRRVDGAVETNPDGAFRVLSDPGEDAG